MHVGELELGESLRQLVRLGLGEAVVYSSQNPSTSTIIIIIISDAH